jgi:uncharacterized membrane protein YdfJ with MMPL/SSD domain
VIPAALLARPGATAAGVVILALLAALAVQQVRLNIERSRTAVAVMERAQAQAAALECSAGTLALREAADRAAQDARRALAAARAASATRAPAIASLAQAEAVPEPAGAALTCADAVERVRDALGR